MTAVLPAPLTSDSAQGEDRSAYQPIENWGNDQFAISKATEGLSLIDPNFAANWANAKAEGKIRGAYHFLHPSESAEGQAALFLETVAAHGIEPGDMLWIDSEITTGAAGLSVYSTEFAKSRSALNLSSQPLAAGAADSCTRAFANYCLQAFPHNPVGVYTNEAVGHTLTSCADLPLWIAYPGTVAPTAISPWTKWTFWQWAFGGGHGGGDQDAFNGTLADLKTWIKKYLPDPAGTQPTTVHGSARWTNATISWSGGTGATSYEVYLANTSHNTIEKASLPPTAHSYTFRHLHMGREYSLGVLAKPEDGAASAKYVNVTTK